NGIVNVSAKDLGTGREQHITITSSSNMSKEDIDKAVKEAEQYAAEDKKKRENVDTKNGAEQAAYQCEQALSELGDKVSEEEKAQIQTKIDAVKEVIKGEDYEAMKAAQEDLMKTFYEISAKVYQANAPQGDPNAAGAEPQNPQSADGYYDGDVQ
ncbi:MAG: Hsp70 family protein, partial [Clostridia bacterium]|nr:Hsp70 family protein [Clostridia bacterium]